MDQYRITSHALDSDTQDIQEIVAPIGTRLMGVRAVTSGYRGGRIVLDVMEPLFRGWTREFPLRVIPHDTPVREDPGCLRHLGTVELHGAHYSVFLLTPQPRHTTSVL